MLGILTGRSILGVAATALLMAASAQPVSRPNPGEPKIRCRSNASTYLDVVKEPTALARITTSFAVTAEDQLFVCGSAPKRSRTRCYRYGNNDHTNYRMSRLQRGGRP